MFEIPFNASTGLWIQQGWIPIRLIGKSQRLKWNNNCIDCFNSSTLASMNESSLLKISTSWTLYFGLMLASSLFDII